MSTAREKYKDIIDLPRWISPKHVPMSMEDRAAQFAPFAALTGHGAAIKETARLTDRKHQLDEDELEVLDWKLGVLLENLHKKPEVAITYFKKDSLKEGGSYEEMRGVIRKLDVNNRKIEFYDRRILSVDDVMDIKSDLF